MNLQSHKPTSPRALNPSPKPKTLSPIPEPFPKAP